MRLLTHVNFGYGYGHMELTGTKHIRGLLTLRKLTLKFFFFSFIETIQAQTKIAFHYSPFFKPLGFPISMNWKLDEKDLHFPKKDYPPKAHTSYVANDDNEKRTPRRF